MRWGFSQCGRNITGIHQSGFLCYHYYYNVTLNVKSAPQSSHFERKVTL